MKKLLTPAKILMLAFIFGAAVALIWNSQSPLDIYRTQPLPEFALTALEGNTPLNTKEWNDYRPRVYNIFASWCGPCREEMPQIKKLGESIPVYGIAVQDNPKNLRKLLKKEGMPFRAVALDPQGAVGGKLGVFALPTTIIIDKYGHVAHVHQGGMTTDDLEQTILPLVQGLHGK